MAIYRGSGSASTTTDQATIDEVTAQATSAANSATSAASSASSAATSASQASGSATLANTFSNTAADHRTEAAGYKNQALASANNAATSETNAAASATTAASEATNAETAETGAVAARAAAEGAQTAAEAAQALAESAQSDASASAASASASASTATTKASEASTSATSASTSASNAATSATQAAASAASAASALDNFDDRYLGAKSADPATDNDGSTLIVGALYFNTTDGVMRIYTASGWINASSSSVATMQKYKFTATSGQTVFSGADDDAETLSITVGAELVTLNGIVLEAGTDYTVTSSSVTLTAGATTSDELNVYAFGNFLVADTVSASTGGTFQAEVTFDGGAAFNDNDKATFGNGDDLQIYHSGTASYISDQGTGNLILLANNLRLKDASDTDDYIRADQGGDVKIFYNGNEKLATTNTGIDVTGTVTADGLTVENPTAGQDTEVSLRFPTGEESYIQWTEAGVASRFAIGVDDGDDFVIKQGNWDGTHKDFFKVAENGDISFYEDTGTTAKFFWDASAESLGIGTTDPEFKADFIVDNGDAIAVRPATSTLNATQTALRLYGHESVLTSRYVEIASANGAGTNANNMVFKTATGTTVAERMRITDTGNVGINLTPTKKLQVLNGSDDDLIIQAYGADSTSEYISLGIQTGEAVLTAGGVGSTSTALVFQTANSGSESEAMRIDSSGNVGIGTSTPGQLLSLKTTGGETQFSMTSDTDQTCAIYLGDTDAVNRGVIQYDNNDDSLRLFTAASEAMRIDSSGNLLVNTPSQIGSNKFCVVGDDTIGLKGSSSTGSGSLKFYRADTGGIVWYISTNHTNFYIADSDFSNYAYLAQNPTAWQFASDRRLKENITDIDYGLESVMALQPRSFNFIGSEKTDIGFIAQELRDVVPEAVTGVEKEFSENDTPEDKANKILGVGKETLIPVLVKAIQEQQAQIESLKARIETLEGN